MQAILVKVLKSILVSLLTEKVVKAVFIELAKWFSEKTETKVDDRLVKTIEQAMNGPQKPSKPYKKPK